LTSPKILFWDIETGFNKTAIFGLGKRWVPHTAVLQERYIICAAFKWLGKDETFAVSLLDDLDKFVADPTDDYLTVTRMHSVLSEADAIVAHYGDNFDIKFFNTRALAHGLDPICNVIQIDTCKMAKAKFMFNSNKLDYLGSFLGLGKKIKTDEQLWHDCLMGKPSAVEEMVAYNIEDVNLLERVYLKLRPFLPARMNFNIFDRDACPKCGHTHVQKRGFQYTLVCKYQRYKCMGCGGWFRGGKAIKEWDTPALR
jgi:hypothetical protein